LAELVRAEGLSHRFRDGGLGLDSVDLCLREGDFLVLAGRNGSGKSLLARHLAGLARPSSGRVLWRGADLAGDPSAARKGLGMVFQDADAQIVGQTLLEDAAFGPANLRLPPGEVERRALAALELVGLAGLGRRRPDSLSGGERRRLAVAGALAMHPDCLVLDEPFANLDYPAIRRLLSIVVGLHEAGTTILLLTHELEKVLAHATRLAVMDGGRLAWEGAPDALGRGAFEGFGLRDPFGAAGGEAAAVGALTWLA
jgi:biotin transport system ATP-binding protein